MKQPKFIIELLGRLFSSNPKFFKALQIVAAVIVVITEIPDLLQFLSVKVPNWVAVLENKALTWNALIIALMAQLPNEDNKPVTP